MHRVSGVNASVGGRRELVANVHIADADATQLGSCVASAVRIGHKFVTRTLHVYGDRSYSDDDVSR